MTDIALAGRSIRVLGLTIALGGLLVVVDTTVTAVALPAIVAGLHTSLPAAQWVTIGYLLGLVSVIPLAGWAVERFGARRVYLTAMIVFTVLSLLAGLAWDVVSLAFFRFVQGLGGGLLTPVGTAIGLRATPREARGRLMSLLALPLAIGPVFGPPLAGWLTDAGSWRWIFLINVPIGLLALAVCRRVLPKDQPLAVVRSIDLPGLALLSGGAVAVVLGGTLLERSLGWLGLLAAGIGMLAVFVRRARRVPEPLVDLRMLEHRPFRAGLGVMACFAAAYFGTMSVLPLFVQGVGGDGVARAGLLVLPQAVVVAVFAQAGTRLIDRIPPRRIVLTGTTLGTAGAIALGTAMATDAGYPWLVAAAMVLAAGSGATLLPAMTVATRDLDHDQTPRGITLLTLANQLASATGGAAVAVSLSLLVSARAPEAGGVGGMLALEPAAREALRPELAAAVGAAYVIPALLLAASTLIAFRALRPVARRG
ncbi:DHA2 family efflux MFS transporter permease subunit [Actinoplanes couchii]|uniref:Multidrug resistance protein B n=1 Tax=Actinoplanes couchii TaxID=403638 RepID=A0ABQ3XD02_9ACTN|nr:DHA2 family efflux MFS transporter permease subunit [Actinoplanes couchii]MDR6321283.1 EmrB/QacA subfamily drug resistance transporter [Actinoplanes couchii]GID56394.1 multidrug resistance protein B [Actinoplanes couchii]